MDPFLLGMHGAPCPIRQFKVVLLVEGDSLLCIEATSESVQLDIFV
jgi:hypothetical protein